MYGKRVVHVRARIGDIGARGGSINEWMDGIKGLVATAQEWRAGQGLSAAPRGGTSSMSKGWHEQVWAKGGQQGPEY
jgi:hypothetical protein